MRKLIVVADDFGFSAGVNRGHIESNQKGIVTEHSFMVDCPGSSEAVKLAVENNIKNVGIHLGLMNLNKDGKYFRKVDYEDAFQNWSKKRLQQRIADEFKSFEDSFGFRPTHINGHQQIHCHPRIVEVVAQYAVDYQVLIRRPHNISGDTSITSPSLLENISKLKKQGVKMTDYLFEEIVGSYEKVHRGFLHKLQSVPDDDWSVELILHPAYVDETLEKYSSMTADRERDLQLAQDQHFRKDIKKLNYKLVSFNNL